VYLQDDNDDVEVRGARVLRIKDTIVAPLASSQTANDSPGQSNPEQPNPEQDSPPSDGYIGGSEADRALHLNKPTSVSSNIWGHFMVETGKKSSKGFCNYCNKGVSRGQSNTTTNLKDHLRRHHPEQHAEFLRENGANGQNNESSGLSKPAIIKDALIEMMVEGHIPYTMLKLRGLRKLMAACGIKNPVPDKRTVQARMGIIEAETKGKLKGLVADKKVSITCDGWKSNNHIDYLGITACWVDDAWKLQTVTLDCSVFPGRHSSQRIAERLKFILKG
jgi:BED zinc finger